MLYFFLPLIATLEFSLRARPAGGAYANTFKDARFFGSLFYSFVIGLVTIVVSTLLIVPTYNESGNLPELVERFFSYVDNVHLLVVGDGPYRRTLEVQAAKSRTLCAGPSGARRNAGFRSSRGTWNVGGTNGLMRPHPTRRRAAVPRR